MALRNQPYFPLYADDFLSDERLAECGAESTGVYIRIMCLMHKSNEYGKILLKQKDKQNTNQIKNFACKLVKHLPYTQDVIEKSLGELIAEEVLQISEDYLIQKRMVKDGEISDVRAKIGAEGGKKTQDFAKAKHKAKIKAKGQANSVNVIVNENDNENINKVSIKDINTFFETIWKLYPKKEGKGQVSESQKRKLHSIGVEEITKAIERYVKVKTGVDRQYLQNGSTFFNTGYLDFLDANYEESNLNTIDDKKKSTAAKKAEIEKEAEDRIEQERQERQGMLKKGGENIINYNFVKTVK